MDSEMLLNKLSEKEISLLDIAGVFAIEVANGMFKLIKNNEGEDDYITSQGVVRLLNLNSCNVFVKFKDGEFIFKTATSNTDMETKEYLEEIK